MRWWTIVCAGIAMAIFTPKGLAGEPAEPFAEHADSAGAAGEPQREISFDLSAWLATEPDPNPLADEIFRAWTEERAAILSGAKAPEFDWHEQLRGYQETASGSDDPFVREVYRRVALDQYGRLSAAYSPHAVSDLAARLGLQPVEADIAAVRDRQMRDFIGIDIDNTAFLQRELDAREGRWWTVAEVGSEVADQIWLLTQHADQTPAFQRNALEQMIPLLDTGDVNRNNYAYLWDRVAVADGRPQRFGTQGRCVEPGDWQAFKIEEPAEEVNERRAAFNITLTFEENDARLDSVCRK